MLKVKNGKIELLKQKALTPKQLARLNSMYSDKAKQAYLLSIMGLKREKLRVDKLKDYSADVLAEKSEDTNYNRMLQIRRLNTNHTPTENAKGQWVGVEIECLIPHQPGDGDSCGDCDDCNDGNSSDCQYASGENWSEEQAHAWLRDELREIGIHRTHVKHDGSVECEDGHGVELAIVFNTKYGYEQLTKLCNKLTELGCYVNKTCGLHVHLDMRHVTPAKAKRYGRSLGHALPVLKYMVAPSRIDNSYCKLKVSSTDRYSAVNMCALREHNTIEVRLHQGSLNAIKIQNWIEVLKLVGVSKLSEDVSTFQELIDAIGMPERLVEYCDRRIQELNPDAWPMLNCDTLPQETEQLSLTVAG